MTHQHGNQMHAALEQENRNRIMSASESSESTLSITASELGEILKNTSFSRVVEKKWVVKNVYGVSISMVMVFTAFIGLQNLQSTINSEDNLGIISLSILYGVFVIMGPFTPTILRLLGTKYSLFWGYICYLVYMLTNFVPRWYTLIPGSLLVGLASGPIWAAAGSHLLEVSVKSSTTLNEDKSPLISLFISVFLIVFHLSQLPGNLASSLTLYPYTTNSSSDTIDYLLPLTWTNSNESTCNHVDTATFKTSSLYFILVGLYSVFVLIGIAILLLSVDKLKMLRHVHTTDKNEPWQDEYFKKPLKEIWRVFRSFKMALLAPITLYTGLEIGFSYATFTRAYISECIGIHNVGFALLAMGVCNSLVTFVCSKIIKFTPPYSIIIAGAAIHGIIFLLLAFWERQPSYLVVYGVAVLWGSGNAIWSTTVANLSIIMFSKKFESAHRVVRMWLDFGFMLGFVISNTMSVSTQAWILIGVLLLALTFIFIIEWAIEPPKRLCPLCYKQEPDQESRELSDMDITASDPAIMVHQSSSHGTALFESGGSIILSELTTSWLNRVEDTQRSDSPQSHVSNISWSNDGSPGEVITTTHRIESKLKSIILHSFESEAEHTTAHYKRKRVRDRRQTCPAYSHTKKVKDNRRRHLKRNNSVPLLSRETARLSTITTNFINSIMQLRQASREMQKSDKETSKEPRSSLFKVYIEEKLENMSSSFIQGDATLSKVSTNAAFGKVRNEGVMNLTASFVTPIATENQDTSEEHTHVDYTSDGSQPQLIEDQVETDGNHAHKRVRSISAPLTPTSITVAVETDANVANQQDYTNAQEAGSSTLDGEHSKNSVAEDTYTATDSGSDVIHINENYDTEDTVSVHVFDIEDASILTKYSV